jgi:hypothetical protein
VEARDKPGHDELNDLPQINGCDSGIFNPSFIAWQETAP